MALIRAIEPITKGRQTLHEETRCCFSVFTDDNGKRYIQLDTYGTRTRQFPGKVSQALQFDEMSARQLQSLIESTFPHLG